MTFEGCLAQSDSVLMEAALGVRLRQEFHLRFDPQVDMAGLVREAAGRRALETLWLQYAGIAQVYGLPFLATTPTRRANRERIAASRFDEGLLGENAAFLRGVRQRSGLSRMFVGALVGCRGDAYTGEGCLDAQEARAFHAWEAEHFAAAGVDFLYAALMPSLGEALGMAQAIRDTGLPFLLSFTIRRDGCLVDGTPIAEAIRRIDGETGGAPAGYMTNCVHPSIVYDALSRPVNDCALVRERMIGLQANASALSFASLDGAETLHSSDPDALAQQMLRLRRLAPIKIFGGCCGTDDRHLRAIASRIGERVR